jgi:hypothetical protein
VSLAEEKQREDTEVKRREEAECASRRSAWRGRRGKDGARGGGAARSQFFWLSLRLPAPLSGKFGASFPSILFGMAAVETLSKSLKLEPCQRRSNRCSGTLSFYRGKKCSLCNQNLQRACLFQIISIYRLYNIFYIISYGQ